MGYTPAFSTMYDGTLCGRWPAAAVWASLLPLIDARGEIRMTYEAISGRTGWPMDLLRQGIAALMQPDPDSQSPAEDGRRLVLIDPSRNWGWRAVNHLHYREKARKQFHDRQRVASGENTARMRFRREATEPENKTIEGELQQPLTRRDPTRPDATRFDRLSYSDANTDSNKKEISTTAEAEVRTNRKPRKPQPAAQPLEPEQMGQFRLEYPRRAGSQPWRRAIACIRARLQEGHTWEELIAGAKRYRAFCDLAGKTGTQYVMQVATFVGVEKHFLESFDPPVEPSPTQTKEQIALQRLIERRTAIGLADFRLPGPQETATQYAKAQDDAWNRAKLAQSLRNSPIAANNGAAPSLKNSVDLARQLAASLQPLNPPIGRRRQP